MKNLLAPTLLAATIAGASVSAANAASVSVNIAFPGIGFSYSSGGYCDSWGCPGDFWNYPIYYCPVYFDGRWYRGPMYYRYSGNRPYFWIRGGWRLDYWRGPRPYGACLDRFGPPLGLDFYIWNGFTIRDEWRYRWRDRRNDWWRNRQDWDRSHRNDTSWRGWLPQQQQNYDWSRDRDWKRDRDWSRPDWNRSDWNRKHNITPPGTGQPMISPNPQQQPGTGDHRDRRGDWQRRQGGFGSGSSSTQPTTNNPPPGSGQSGMGSNPPTTGDHRDRRGNWQGPQGSFGSGSSSTQPTTNNPPQTGNNNPPSNKGGDRRGRGHGNQDQGQGPNAPQ